MKKRIVALLLSFAMIACTLAGCSPRTPTTIEAFTQTMEAEGFTMVDVTATTDTQGLATNVLLAINEDHRYQIELFILADNETGEGMFTYNKSYYDSEYAAKSSVTEIFTNNYNYYAFTAGGQFHVVTRIDNTLLYCDADSAYKDEIVDLIEKLGY